jgi:hypothetical protein
LDFEAFPQYSLNMFLVSESEFTQIERKNSLNMLMCFFRS